MHYGATHDGWVRQSCMEEENRSSRVGHDGPHGETIVLSPPHGGSLTDGGVRSPDDA
jgi:hypothetical protein